MINCHGKTKSSLDWWKKKWQKRMATISYDFHFEKEISIGQTTGYKQKWGYRVWRKSSWSMETSSKITSISWKTCSKRDMMKSHQVHQMVTNGNTLWSHSFLMGQLSLILGKIFMSVNQNYQELVWQKFKTHIRNEFTLFSCELVRIRSELVW